MCPVSPAVLCVSPSSLPLRVSLQVSCPRTLVLRGLFHLGPVSVASTCLRCCLYVIFPLQHYLYMCFLYPIWGYYKMFLVSLLSLSVLSLSPSCPLPSRLSKKLN